MNFFPAQGEKRTHRKVILVRTVNRKRGETGDEYIGRGSIWGNPYIIGRDGDRATVIEKYREYLWEQIKAGRVTEEQLLALDGKTLECYCAPKPCHGDVLIAAVAWVKDKEAERRAEANYYEGDIALRKGSQ